jgi:membrane-bound ClpP family serine protease
VIGLSGIVTRTIDPDDTDRKGRVSVDGEVWGAITRSDDIVQQGVRVKIVEVLGTRVVVEPISLPTQQNQGMS